MLLDEAAGAAHEVEAHQLTPIVGMRAFLERGQRAHRTLMATDEFGLAELLEIPLRPNAQVVIGRDEQAKLAAEVEVALVVGRRREHQAFAVSLADELQDGAIAPA